MNFIIFASVFLTVFALLSVYIAKRLVNKLDFSPRIKLYLNTFLIFNYFGVILYMLSRYQISVPNTLYFIFSLSIGLIFLLFVSTLFYDIFHWFIKITPVNATRRQFLKKTLDIGSLSIATALSAKAIYTAKEITLETITVPIDNLKKAYKIVQLSDVHIGGLIEKDFISNVVQRVNNLNPDIVVITGDLVDTDLRYIKEAINELQNLKSTYGTYFIVGNHEYFHGVEEIMKYLNSIGIKVLENENVYIGEENYGFNLAGVYDVFGYRYGKYQPDITQALKGIKPSPTVLLAHQPKYIFEVKKDVDLVLSGHTHGGQIFPFNYLVSIVQPYIKGLHQHNKKTQIYVNKGTGFWGPPMRLGASAEITQLLLKEKII